MPATIYIENACNNIHRKCPLTIFSAFSSEMPKVFSLVTETFFASIFRRF